MKPKEECKEAAQARNEQPVQLNEAELLQVAGGTERKDADSRSKYVALVPILKPPI